MTIAAQYTNGDEEFTRGGRRYAWREGLVDPRTERLRSRRGALPGIFVGAVLPGLVRRGAERRTWSAGPRCTEGVGCTGTHRPYWVTWQARGDGREVWALYVPTRRPPGADVEAPGWGDGATRPANDGDRLAAWGEGPVLAWVSESAALRVLVRAALRVLPPFLADGVTSGDATLALRIERVDARPKRLAGPRP